MPTSEWLFCMSLDIFKVESAVFPLVSWHLVLIFLPAHACDRNVHRSTTRNRSRAVVKLDIDRRKRFLHVLHGRFILTRTGAAVHVWFGERFKGRTHWAAM